MTRSGQIEKLHVPFEHSVLLRHSCADATAAVGQVGPG